MVPTKNSDKSDDDVPLSERGKSENMYLEERSPGSVFGIVGLTYLIVLFLAAVAFGMWFYF